MLGSCSRARCPGGHFTAVARVTGAAAPPPPAPPRGQSRGGGGRARFPLFSHFGGRSGAARSCGGRGRAAPSPLPCRRALGWCGYVSGLRGAGWDVPSPVVAAAAAAAACPGRCQRPPRRCWAGIRAVPAMDGWGRQWLEPEHPCRPQDTPSRPLFPPARPGVTLSPQHCSEPESESRFRIEERGPISYRGFWRAWGPCCTDLLGGVLNFYSEVSEEREISRLCASFVRIRRLLI